jgi:exopolysaccharide production protein ExoY
MEHGVRASQSWFASESDNSDLLALDDPEIWKCAIQEAPSQSLRLQLAVKRLFDIAASLALLVLLLPLMLVVAMCIRVTSRGPTLFKQERCGWRGKNFVCLKFRSMFVDQAKLIDSDLLGRSEQQGLLLKFKKDPRVTPLGAVLRQTSIDELPQLWNVLKGEMSLIGPRPLVPHMLAPYPELSRIRGQVRPGITCLWQVCARHQNTSFLYMAPYDLVYIRNFTLWLDFKILLHTPAAVLLAKGAH